MFLFYVYIFILESSSIIDVINECLTACNRPNVDHYRRKIQDDQSDLNDTEIVDRSEYENQEDTVSYIYYN